MKLLILVTSCFVVVGWATGNRKIDDVKFKNHRISKNETQNPIYTYKYPIYPVQQYTNVSNIMNYTTARSIEESKTTEMPLDVVRMFITPINGKRKQDYTASTAQSTYGPSTSATPSVYVVTAKNVAYVTNSQEKKSPVYVHPSTINIKDIDPTIWGRPIKEDEYEDKSNSELEDDDIQIRRVSKTQNQGQSNLLYATTQSTSTGNKRTTVAYAVPSKVTSSNASKPFTTVLVPKHMLDGDFIPIDYIRNDTFRPTTRPVFSYKQIVDTDITDNRKTSNIDKTQTESAQKIIKFGFMKPAVSYKVEEYPSNNEEPSIIYDRSYNLNNKQDRLNQVYMSAENSDIDNTKWNQEIQHSTPKYDIKYGFQASESSVYDQLRELYPATETPIKEVKSYSSYNPTGKFDTKYSTLENIRSQFESEKTLESSKDYPSSSWISSENTETESNGPEPSVNDVNTKHILQSVLRDKLKSQFSDVKLKSTIMDEIMDLYLKNNRPNLDSTSQDNYKIETEMSCNLRSTRYITDGQCVSTKPVVEAVCADRCLVYAKTLPIAHRQRMSSLQSNQEVEALHCVDGDVQFVRIQLYCRDGNTLNNIIKVVTNCRCKLHEIQPLMKSNTQDTLQSVIPNPDIMKIVNGKFLQ